MDQLNVEIMLRLTQANEVRFARSRDKKAIKHGRLTASTILKDVPTHWGSAQIIELLLAMPRVGRVKAQRWLNLEMISPSKRLDTLTPRQRAMLARHIDTWSSRRDNVRRSLA